MAHEAWPVAITSIRGLVAGTVVWRQLGRLNVTVVLKGTFALVADGVMTPASPRPLARDEHVDETGRGLTEAGDLAPYLRQSDIWLTGHIDAPAGGPAGQAPPAIVVRLGVFRDKTALIDKSFDLRAAEGGAARAKRPTRIPVAGFGPLSRSWPVRSRLAGASGLRQLPGPLLEIPDTFDWSYFQAAPPDQRVDRLRGDEWIVLAGLHPKRASFSTRLPGVKGAARIHDRSRAGGPGQPLELTADTVRIDLDRQICSITWRGRFPVASQAALSSLHIAAAIEWPGRPTAWSDPTAPKASLAKTRRAHAHESAAPPAAPPAAPAAKPAAKAAKPAAKQAAKPPAAGTHESTMAISADEVARLAASAPKATPFEGGPPRVSPTNPGAPVSPPHAGARVSSTNPGETAPVDVDAVLKARESSVPFAPAAPPAAPFQVGATAAIDVSAVLKAREASVPFAPPETSFQSGETAAIDVGAVLKAREASVPFARAAARPNAGTAPLDEAALAAAVAAPAVPFTRAAAPAPVPLPPEPNAASWSPAPLPIPTPEATPAHSPPPPKPPAISPPPILGAAPAEAPAGPPRSPGAHFVAAMARHASAHVLRQVD